MNKSELEANIDQVLGRVAKAAQRARRDPTQIRLLPVTKTVPSETLQKLAELGYPEMAENRVQDLRDKQTQLEESKISWVLIGHLQSNKVGQAARIVSEVQSVSSLKIAQALSRQTQTLEKTLRCFIQVNTSGEDTKGGFQPHELSAALDSILTLPGLDVRGLMTMAPYSTNPEDARPSFRQLRTLRDEVAPQLPELSMGMSGDYEVAIEEGATTIRVGSALFGPRHR